MLVIIIIVCSLHSTLSYLHQTMQKYHEYTVKFLIIKISLYAGDILLNISNPSLSFDSANNIFIDNWLPYQLLRFFFLICNIVWKILEFAFHQTQINYINSCCKSKKWNTLLFIAHDFNWLNVNSQNKNSIPKIICFGVFFQLLLLLQPQAGSPILTLLSFDTSRNVFYYFLPHQLQYTLQSWSNIAWIKCLG